MEHKQKKAVKYSIYAVLFLLIGGCFLYIGKLKQKITSGKITIEALSNTMVKYRDKNGAEVTEARLILSSYKDLKALHVSDSSTIGRLQNLVNKNTISATAIKNTTSGTITGKTKITFKNVSLGNNRDTLPILTEVVTMPCDTVYPEYQDSITSKWANMNVLATKDSIKVDYTVFNEYEISQEYKKEGNWPFRKKVPIVKIKNLNPHTVTTEIASYAVQVPKTGKKITTIAAVAAGLGFLTALFIVK